MEVIEKLALIDWLAMMSVLALIGLALGAESGAFHERRREAAFAMLGLAALFGIVLVTSDAKDSVFFAGLAEEKPAREKKTPGDEPPQQASDSGGEPGKDSSGPGDGDGGQGEDIKLTLVGGPALARKGGVGGGSAQKNGAAHGGAGQKQGQLQIESAGGENGEGGSDAAGRGGSAAGKVGSADGGGQKNGAAPGGAGQQQGQQKNAGAGGGNGEGGSDAAGRGGSAASKAGSADGGGKEADEFPVLKEAAAAGGASLQDCPDCPRMVLVPAGAFEIGTGLDVPGYRPEEGPPTRVRFRNPFYIARFEVTRAEFAHFVMRTGHEPSRGCVVDYKWQTQRSFEQPGFIQDPNHPAVCVNWYDAMAYVEWLSKLTRKTYRLPSEAEWEYAARGGRQTLYPSGDTLSPSDANYAYRTRGTLPVGQFNLNQYGIADMAGNAWEMLADCWEADYAGLSEEGTARDKENCEMRVIRGGAWYNGPRYLRVSTRWSNPAAAAGNGVGFRVVRDFMSPETAAKAGRRQEAPKLSSATVSAAEQSVRQQVDKPILTTPERTISPEPKAEIGQATPAWTAPAVVPAPVPSVAAAGKATKKATEKGKGKQAALKKPEKKKAHSTSR
jgi:formylglycine-generating enzyme required for sulfatase activity